MASSFGKTSGRRIPPTISRSATKQHLPWSYHRVLTMRDNPLETPSDWLDAKHAALDVSAHEWFRSWGLSERAIALAYGLNVSFGRDAHDVSALLLLFRGAFSREQRALAPSESLGFTARDGVQRLPEAMAAALANGVELDHAVTGIALENDRAVVTCANGRRFSAGHVIAAVPPPVLRRIAVEPKLPALQADAIATLPSQPLTQVYLAPRSRFWEQDGYAASLFTDTRAGMLAAARKSDDPAEVTSLTAWITGDNAAALDRLPAGRRGPRRDLGDRDFAPRREGPARAHRHALVGRRSECRRRVGLLPAGRSHALRGRAWAAARPIALLRRAFGDGEPRHGGRDGIGRRGRRRNPRERLKSAPPARAKRPRSLSRIYARVYTSEDDEVA